MSGIFRLLKAEGEEERGHPALVLGIDLRIGERQVPCPISGVCRSREELAREVEAVKASLQRLLGEGAALFEKGRSGEGGGISPDMKAEEVWSVLSAIPEEDRFRRLFNGLDEAKRREVAEHVLTHCNVFTGRGAGFSADFNSDTALLE
jgi:hypothetical protein